MPIEPTSPALQILNRQPFRQLLRFITILSIATLVACSGTKTRTPRSISDGAPRSNVDISKIPEPVPKFEPPARYGNHSPYVVLGKRYQVLPGRAGYKATGIASWYGTKFHGKLTSNREPYDMYSFTAAHKSLPLPSYARVTNLDNQRSIIVRINDRGPFVGDREIDLSYVAAVKLGIYAKGTGRVHVETITPGEPVSRLGRPAISSVPSVPIVKPSAEDIAVRASAQRLDLATQEGGFLLQCGAFSDFSNANSLKVRLLDAGFSDARVSQGQDALHRVVLGPLISQSDAEVLASDLIARGFVSPKILTP
jgi:rare lipoprotein A